MWGCLKVEKECNPVAICDPTSGFTTRLFPFAVLICWSVCLNVPWVHLQMLNSILQLKELQFDPGIKDAHNLYKTCIFFPPSHRQKHMWKKWVGKYGVPNKVLGECSCERNVPSSADECENEQGEHMWFCTNRILKKILEWRETFACKWPKNKQKRCKSQSSK